MDDGFTCNAELRDDRGYTWKSQSAYGFGLPTDCNDYDRNVPGKVAKIFIVPEDAVPRLLGVVTPPTSNLSLSDGRRVLIRP